MKDKKISVGFSGSSEDLKKILEASEDLFSVYTGGLSGKIAGGRPDYLSSLDELKRNSELAHSYGVNYEIALNAPCGLESKENKQWWASIIEYFKEIESCGVDYIIASHPFIMQAVKENTNMKIVTSTICEITTARSAMYYESMGSDVIIPSMNANYDMEALEQMKNCLKKASLRIMVNEHCLGDCPWRRFHHNHYAHHNEELEYHINCKSLFYKNPYLMLTNNYIRPEDIHRYEAITKEFKIVGRLKPINELVNIIQAYSKEEYRGNSVKLTDLGLAEHFNIPNEQLSDLFDKKIHCNKICKDCGYCIELYEAITKNSGMKSIGNSF